MTSPVLSICLSCTMYRSDDPSRCDAFPDGIPDNILLRLYDHRRPYPGDHGIRYEPDASRQPMLESYDEVIAMDGDGNHVGMGKKYTKVAGDYDPAIHGTYDEYLVTHQPPAEEGDDDDE